MTGDGRRPTGDGEQLTCDQFADRLADFLEREVDERSRAAVEAHAIACGDCGPLLADLRKLRIDTANLPELTPSRDLWSGIAARIETPVIELRTTDEGRGTGNEGRRRAWVGRRTWTMLAAAGLVAITASITHMVTKQSIARDASRQTAAVTVAPPETTTVAAVPSSAQADTTKSTSAPASVAAVSPPSGGVALAQVSQPSSLVSRPSSPVELEIARLKAIVNRRRAQLDPATLGIVDRNLSVIDTAIAQVKQALQRDPESRFLMESLNNALDNKVEVLRTAALLPSRT
jgi:hypothetical protein